MQESMDLEDNQTNCSILFTEDQVRSLVIARATTGAVCFLANALTLLAIIFYQAWRTQEQQVFFYLSVASLLFSLSYLIPANISRVCVAAGFLEGWFEFIVVFLAYGVSAALLVEQTKILMKWRRKDSDQNVKSTPRNRKWSTLTIHITAIFYFIFPIWVPSFQFLDPSLWCLTTYSNCTPPVIIITISIELFFGSVLFCITFTLLLSFLRWVCVSKPPASKAIVTIIVMEVVLWLFATLLVVVIVIQLLAFIFSNYELRMTYTVLKPIILLLLPPAIWIYYSGKDLDYKQAKKRWAHCFKKKQHAFQPAMAEGEQYTEFIDPSSEGTLSYRPPLTSDSLDDRSGSVENTPLHGSRHSSQ